MRYSRMQQDAETSHRGRGSIAFWAAVVAVVAAIYWIGAGKVGDFLTEKVWKPVVGLVSGEEIPSQQTGSTAVSAGQVTQELPGMHIYGLQAGVYSDENNAAAFAESLCQKGGAGYIYADGEIYRVLLAAYATEADAKSVQQRLQTEQTMETKVYEISYPAKQLTLPAEGAALLQNGARPEEVVASLMELALSYDKGETDAAAAKTQLQTWSGKLSAAAEALADAEGGAAQLRECCVKAAQGIEDAAAAAEGAALSAGIKYAYLQAAFAARQLAGGLGV